MLLFKGAVFVVQLKVVYVSHTAFRVFEGGVHVGVGWQLIPGVHTFGVFHVLPKLFQLLCAIKARRASIGNAVVPEVGEL